MSPARIISTVPLAAIVAFLVFRHTGTGDENVTPPPDPVLSRIVPTADFDEIGLGDVLESLSDQTNATIRVDWHRLATAGINARTPVTVYGNGAALGDVLRDVLIVAGGSGGKLWHTVADGEIAVTDRDTIALNRICRMYYVADLLDELELSKWPGDGIPHVGPLPRFRWQPQGEYLFVTSNLYPGWIAGKPPGIPADLFYRRNALWYFLSSPLMHEPFMLESISPIGGQLIVIATPEEHDGLSAMLRDLRRRHIPEMNRGRLNDGSH